MMVGRGTGVTLGQLVGVTVTIPQPVWQFLHTVSVGQTVVVVGDTAMLGQPHSNVTAADYKVKKTLSACNSPSTLARRGQDVSLPWGPEVMLYVPSAKHSPAFVHVVGQPVVAVTVAVGRNVQYAGSLVGTVMSTVLNSWRAATSMGFAATSVLFFLVSASFMGLRHDM